PVPDCFNNTCGSGPDNPIANTGTSGQLGADVFTIQSTDGKNVLRVVTVPRLYFICGNNFVNDGLASGVTGIAGLGRTGASLPAQLSSYFRFNRVFALCLSSSTRSSGAVFFGNGPYTLLPNVDASSGLTYTPLIVNPATENGFLGDASPKVPNVAPFGACFSSKNIGSTRLGPAVPTIDLVLQSKNVWSIFGANSMVEVSKDVLCLGFVEARTDITPRSQVRAGTITKPSSQEVSLREWIDLGTLRSRGLRATQLQFDLSRVDGLRD
nr:basic 7S globulin-like [Tanacetum cinerariifolium]